VRDEIITQIAKIPALIVVVTQHSARSPWVWLEVGCRLGSATASKPLFVVRSDEDVSLLQPVADLRAVRLDDEGQLQELVKAVSTHLRRPTPEFLDYSSAAREMSEFARQYSPGRAGRGRETPPMADRLAGLAGRWWVVAAAVVALLSAGTFVYSWQSVRAASSRAEATIIDLNKALLACASEYLRLNAVVVADDGKPVGDATVLLSKGKYIDDEPSCHAQHDAKECAVTNTDSSGRFSVDLTQIQVTNSDKTPVNVTIIRPDFQNYHALLEVDVRAMDRNDPPKRIVWSSVGTEAEQ
jgi:hypothetical protein